MNLSTGGALLELSTGLHAAEGQTLGLAINYGDKAVYNHGDLLPVVIRRVGQVDGDGRMQVAVEFAMPQTLPRAA